MIRTNSRLITILTILIVGLCGTVFAQKTRDRITRGGCGAASGLNGVYRIDLDGSDKLYPVIESATSNVPFGDQQQFFIDLAVRLTPPDMLAIECRGNRVSLGSSRSPRVEFVADGVTRNARTTDGRVVRSRIRFEREGSLTFSSSGGSDDLNFTFTPLENGKRLQVTRRISAQELIEPVVINTVYEKIGDVARWDIFDKNQKDTQITEQAAKQNEVKISPNTGVNSASRTPRTGNSEVNTLRDALDQWIDATNRRDIETQMSFYMSELKAFYLSRNASLKSVRAEKNRAFATAKSIDVRAAEPEIIFQDGGRTAVMRFRKKYRIVSGSRSRSGEVVQELRWQKAGGDWKIFSERDIRVLR
jgi:ketosteroid isomerase-like protein